MSCMCRVRNNNPNDPKLTDIKSALIFSYNYV